MAIEKIEKTTEQVEQAESPFMTPKEVAAYLKVTRQAVMNQSKTGGLPEPVRIGRSVRFQREEVYKMYPPRKSR